MHLAAMREHGDPIPEPSHFELVEATYFSWAIDLVRLSRAEPSYFWWNSSEV